MLGRLTVCVVALLLVGGCSCSREPSQAEMDKLRAEIRAEVEAEIAAGFAEAMTAVMPPEALDQARAEAQALKAANDAAEK